MNKSPNKWLQTGLILLVLLIWGLVFTSLDLLKKPETFQPTSFDLSNIKNKIDQLKFHTEIRLPNHFHDPFLAKQTVLIKSEPVPIEITKEVQVDFSGIILHGIIGRTIHATLFGTDYLISNKQDTLGFHFIILSQDSISVSKNNKQTVIKLY